MRVKVTISSTGHLFGEVVTVDVGQPGSILELGDVAHYFLTQGLIIGDRWISPIRIMEFTIVAEDKKIVLREGENA